MVRLGLEQKSPKSSHQPTSNYLDIQLENLTADIKMDLAPESLALKYRIKFDAPTETQNVSFRQKVGKHSLREFRAAINIDSAGKINVEKVESRPNSVKHTQRIWKVDLDEWKAISQMRGLSINQSTKNEKVQLESSRIDWTMNLT